MATPTPKAPAPRRRSGTRVRLLILAVILLLVNILAARFHYGLDLTAEHRFTLSPSTKALLRGMDDDAVFTVYLKADGLEADFKRLSEATRERLQAFREVAGPRIRIRFVDPFEEAQNDDDKAKVFRTLADKGIVGIPFGSGKEGQYSSNILFPYALLGYKGREVAISLLEGKLSLDRREMIHTSETLLEYKLARAIHLLAETQKPLLAYIVGHGEALGEETRDALTQLAVFYRVDTFDLTQHVYIPRVYNAAIVLKPTQPYSEKEAFKLDQYVMGGGKLLLALDGAVASLDSLNGGEAFLATENPHGLGDLLFRFGARINADLVEDLNCARLPVVVGQEPDGGQPIMELRPWYFFPRLSPGSKHPMVNNMDAVLSRFPSSIDTVGGPEVRKTVLLESSQYSRVAPVPARVSLSAMRYEPKRALFNKPFRPVAVLLEGEFTSAFNNRLHPATLQMLDSIKRTFKPKTDSATSVIVVANGDIFTNTVLPQSGAVPMGYWHFEKMPHANPTFFLNCVEYLASPGSPLESRSKDLRLRLLDADRVEAERTKWQVVNVAVPVGLLAVFASAYLFFRRRRWGTGA